VSPAPGSDGPSAGPEPDTQSRQAFFAASRALTPLLGVRVGDALFAVATDDRGVSRRLFVNAWRRDMGALERAMGTLASLGVGRPEVETFVDVGANIGTTTVTALRRHAFHRGIALEPSPDNFRLLRMNLAANDLETRVTALQVAASDREEVVRFDVSERKKNKGTHRIAPADTADDGPGTIAVEATSLDGLVAREVIDPASTGLVWLDVQGHEPNVLLGATSLIAQGVPLILTIWPDKKQARDGVRVWRGDEEVRATVLERLLGSYTDVFVLPKQVTRRSIDELPDVVNTAERSREILLVRT
jgi:FkbM family methyltransferase